MFEIITFSKKQHTLKFNHYVETQKTTVCMTKPQNVVIQFFIF